MAYSWSAILFDPKTQCCGYSKLSSVEEDCYVYPHSRDRPFPTCNAFVGDDWNHFHKCAEHFFKRKCNEWIELKTLTKSPSCRRVKMHLQVDEGLFIEKLDNEGNVAVLCLLIGTSAVLDHLLSIMILTSTALFNIKPSKVKTPFNPFPHATWQICTRQLWKHFGKYMKNVYTGIQKLVIEQRIELWQ